MPSIDMPLEQMRQYKPSLYREADFDSYWDSTVAALISDLKQRGLLDSTLVAWGGESRAGTAPTA